MSDKRPEVHSNEALRAEATDWLVRLRAPGRAVDQVAFENWYDADPRHAEAYDAVIVRWECAVVLADPQAAVLFLAQRDGVDPWRSWKYVAMALATALFLMVLSGLA